MNRSDDSEVTLSENELRAVDAEQRVNLIRICAIAGFYLIHLWHVSAPRLGDQAAAVIGFDSGRPVSANAHLYITLLCLAWLMQAFAVHLMISQRRVTDFLSTVSSLGDLGWLTGILCLSTGPAGPMVAGYFLIIMVAGLRFNLRLIRITTVGAIACYLILLGVARWPRGIVNEIGFETIPRYHQIMILLAMVFAGIIIGQIVRHTYLMSAIAGRSKRNRA